MLEFKIDIVPLGNEKHRHTISKLIVINTGDHKDRPEYGNYICNHDGGSFRIENHKRSNGAWSLLRKCLDKYLHNGD